MKLAEPDDNVEIAGPFGMSVKAHGSQVVFLVTILAGFAALAGYLYTHETAAKERQESSAMVQTQILKELRDVLRAEANARAETNYLLSLPQEERQRLRLEMPESMRARMRDR